MDDDTKVVWASSPAPLPFVKPRDFVTVVNVRRLEDGSIVVVNRGYRHPAAPVSCFVDVAGSGGAGGAVRFLVLFAAVYDIIFVVLVLLLLLLPPLPWFLVFCLISLGCEDVPQTCRRTLGLTNRRSGIAGV